MPLSNGDNDNGGNGGDRRAHSRRRVLLSGKLAYPHVSVTADCVIRDISQGGARVTAPGLALPHDPFLVVIKYASMHEARTAWQNGADCGLAFLNSWRLSDPHFQSDAPLRALWLELLPR